MNDIKAILFDFGGTLDSDGVHWFTRFHDIINDLGDVIDGDVFQAIAEKAANDLGVMPDSKTLLMHETAHRFCKLIHAGVQENNGVISLEWNPAQVSDIFMSKSRTVLRRNRHVLRHLRSRFRLGCISNNWGNAAGWCRQFQFAQYFDTMIDSTVVGSVKPDSKIFQMALDEMKLSAAQCIYVGDHYECDVEGSRAIGMLPIWILADSNGQSNHDPNVRRINKLPDLLEMQL